MSSEQKKRSSSNDENENSSGASDSDAATSSDSGTDAESDLDERECDRRRKFCIRKVLELERQFGEIKESLYHERTQILDQQLRQVRDETAVEYMKRLSALTDNFLSNEETADEVLAFQTKELNILRESEEEAAKENCDNEKRLLFERLKEEVEEKMAKLETDKRNADLNFEFWQRETRRPMRNATNVAIEGKRNASPTNGVAEKRRKPTTVTGPFVVYMLKQSEILDDWNQIQRAIVQADLRDKQHV